jgi:hypothetical protein
MRQGMDMLQGQLGVKDVFFFLERHQLTGIGMPCEAINCSHGMRGNSPKRQRKVMRERLDARGSVRFPSHAFLSPYLPLPFPDHHHQSLPLSTSFTVIITHHSSTTHILILSCTCLLRDAWTMTLPLEVLARPHSSWTPHGLWLGTSWLALWLP